jgi:HEAT repeat protein
MLRFIWITSIVLGLAAILIMTALVVLRVVNERRADRAKAERRHVLSALIRFSEDGNRSAVEAVLGSIPAAIVADAGFEFLELLRGEEREAIEAAFSEAGLPDFIRGRLHRGNEADRIHATEMLAAFPGPETVRSLEVALEKDHAREVRISAAIALSKLGSLPPLERVLSRIGPRGQRSRRLVELFQSLPTEHIEQLAVYAAQEDCPAFVRAAAVDALSMSGDYRFMPVYEQLAGNKAPEVAAAAVRALGRLGHPGASATLFAAMESPDWQIRAEAAAAAGRIGLDNGVERLSGLLADSEWTVRYAAGKAMKALGAPGIEALRKIAEDEGSRSQRTASMVLAEGQAQ